MKIPGSYEPGYTISCFPDSCLLAEEELHEDLVLVVYYESIKRELKTRPIYDCRCDEKLKPKDDESTCVTYTGLLEELEYL